MKLRLLVAPLAGLLFFAGCYDFELESREFSCEQNQICQESQVCFEGTCQQRQTSLRSFETFYTFNEFTSAQAGRICENAKMYMVSQMSDEARCAMTGIEASEGCGWGKQICLEGSFPQASPEFICDYIDEFVACPTNLYGSLELRRCLEEVMDDVLHHLHQPDVCAEDYAIPESFQNLSTCRDLELVCLQGMFSSCTLEEHCPENSSCVEPSSECGTGYCAQPSFRNPHCTISCTSGAECPGGSLCENGHCLRR